ncbi:uncharacterized protein [Pyrus communis]|uniref:uncharacterized protein n=1 Tax=Pyrus communis TaxID=23211 RepID=UPI0035C240B2
MWWSQSKPLITTVNVLLLSLHLHLLPTPTLSQCRTSCGPIPIHYPFALDDGCGAPQFRHMFNCSTDLFFATPSGNYKVQSINYDKKTMVVYDPAMSTCSILQPHHDFLMTPIQSAIIPPTSDTVFALLNCSVDSPVLNHYKYLCFNFSGHSCDELYDSCNAFRIFRTGSGLATPTPSPGGFLSNGTTPSPGGFLSNGTTPSPGGFLTNGTPPPPATTTTSPPCCFTGYDSVKFMSMNILDCTHYTSVTNTDGLKGLGPPDWVYGIKLSFAVPDTGCERCAQSGGTCGFDTETEGSLCLCSTSSNFTRQCGAGSFSAVGRDCSPNILFQASFVILGALLVFLHEFRMLNL